jgi:hypothetical protein
VKIPAEMAADTVTLDSDVELLLLTSNAEEGQGLGARFGRKAAVALGITLGVAALMALAGSSLPQKKVGMVPVEVENNMMVKWLELPKMDAIIERAKNLESPVRGLETVMYADDPAEFAAMRTQCVIDTVQSSAYLGQAVVFLYKAIDYRGLKCPDDSEAGCAVSVAGFITSIAWLASYLSLAASSCADTVNSASLCVADFTGLIANAGEIATAGAAVHTDCDFAWSKPTVAPTLTAQEKANDNTQSDEERNFDRSQCSFDVAQAASYVVRSGLQIRAAASTCPDPKNCAMNVLGVLSSFAWISQFTALAASDCPDGSDQDALCTADISDLVAGTTNWVAGALASTSDCKDPDPVEEIKVIRD